MLVGGTVSGLEQTTKDVPMIGGAVSGLEQTTQNEPVVGGDVGLESVAYQDLGSSTFLSIQMFVDKKRNRIIRFVVGDGLNNTFNFNVVLALYDINSQNEEKIVYNKLQYTNEFRGLLNLQYYDEDLGILYAQIQVADSITGETNASGFSGQLCKLEIDFDNVSNTNIEIITPNNVGSNSALTNLFYVSEYNQVYYYANETGFFKKSTSTGNTITEFSSLSLSINTSVRSVEFNFYDDVFYAILGAAGGASKFYKIDFKNLTSSVSSNTVLFPSFVVSGKIINENLFEIYMAQNSVLVHRLYDFNLNLITELSVGFPVETNSVASFQYVLGELYTFIGFRYFRKIVPAQTTKQ